MHDLTQIPHNDGYSSYGSNPARRAIMDQPDGAGISYLRLIINMPSFVSFRTAVSLLRPQQKADALLCLFSHKLRVFL